MEIARLVSEFRNAFGDAPADGRNELNLSERSRRNPLLWRGQFAPELVELLLDRYAPKDSLVLDPFVGSGTVLFESARKGLPCIGTEINPVAVEMAKTSLFCNLSVKERQDAIRTAWNLLKEKLSKSDIDEWGSDEGNKGKKYALMTEILKDGSENPLVYNILANVILRFSLLPGSGNPEKMTDAFEIHKNFIKELPYSDKQCAVFSADARALPVEDNSVDLVITSPPYMNVFKYSQNYLDQKMASVFGWNLLGVAKHELGRIRQGKGNSFLTVTQYALDLQDTLRELRRVISDSGRAIVVIGRKSEICGVEFENSTMLYSLAAYPGSGFGVALRQERQFTTADGNRICEDLLHLVPEGKIELDDSHARAVAKFFLKEALEGAKGVVRSSISDAIRRIKETKKSQLFEDE
jgi:DNA modification methylase